MPRQGDEAVAAAAGNPIPAAAGVQPAGGVPPPAPTAVVDGNQARADVNVAGGQALPPNFADLFGDASEF